MRSLLLPAGTSGDSDGSSVHISPASAGWEYSGLSVLALSAGGARTIATGTAEMAVMPLSGSCVVEAEGHSFDIDGRPGVFDGIAGFAYIPIDCEVRVSSGSGGEIALCTAEARRRIEPYSVRAAEIPIEVRGGGVGTRQINNFLSADMFEADRLIAVEVITPDGSWSSYPPHKHDELSPDEVPLEEIYYFRIEGEAGIGFFNCYTSDDEINETVLVRDGDVYLVPRGYHGPAAATPGHHMYYLNVMAGPSDERVWKFCDDPAHAWVRSALDALPRDPRLPLTTADGRAG